MEKVQETFCTVKVHIGYSIQANIYSNEYMIFSYFNLFFLCLLLIATVDKRYL